MSFSLTRKTDLFITPEILSQMGDEYTVEIWCQLSYYPVIARKDTDSKEDYQTLPTVLYLSPDCRLQINHQHILINDYILGPYQSGQWTQITLIRGLIGSVADPTSSFYLNGQLVYKTNYLLPSVTAQSQMIFGKDVSIDTYPLINPLDDDPLKFAIIKVYNRVLDAAQVLRNYQSHQTQLTGRGTPYAHITRGLILCHGCSENKNHGQYYMSSVSDKISVVNKPFGGLRTPSDSEMLAKVISQIMTGTKPVMTVSPEQLALTMHKNRNYIEDLLLPQSTNGSLFANPLRVAIMDQFFQRNPQVLMNILSDPTVDKKTLLQLYTLYGNKVTVVDQFVGGSESSDNQKDKISVLDIMTLDQVLDQMAQALSQTYINYNPIDESSQRITRELKKIEGALTPSKALVAKISKIEAELQTILQRDLSANTQNQVKVLELIKTFQGLKNRVLYQLYGDTTIRGMANNLERKLKNAEKICLQSPQTLGYLSNGCDRLAIIDKAGQIHYTRDKSDTPLYVALKSHKPSATQLTSKHRILGQVVDQSQKQALAVVITDGQNEQIVSIKPVAKIPQLPVKGVMSNKLATPQPTRPQCQHRWF